MIGNCCCLFGSTIAEPSAIGILGVILGELLDVPRRGEASHGQFNSAELNFLLANSAELFSTPPPANHNTRPVISQKTFERDRMIEAKSRPGSDGWPVAKRFRQCCVERVVTYIVLIDDLARSGGRF